MASYFTESAFLLAEIPEGGFRGGLQTVWNFFYTGGWFMLPIVICSFAALTIVVFKFIHLRREAILPRKLAAVLEEVEDYISAGRLVEINRALRTQDSPCARICRHALLSSHASKEDAERSTEVMAREEISRLETGIPALEVIFTIAPLLGLIGTVSGLVRIFGAFGGQGVGPDQAQFISMGISEALNATIAGLVVAVPCYFFQSFFLRKLEALALRMSTLTTGLIHAAYRSPEDVPLSPQTKKIIHPQISPTPPEPAEPTEAETNEGLETGGVEEESNADSTDQDPETKPAGTQRKSIISKP